MSDLSLLRPTLTVVPSRPAALATQAFAWPMPPLSSYPLPMAQNGPEPCEVEGRNGQRMAGTLLSLDVVQAVAHVHVPPEAAPLPLRLEQMRSLTLTRPLTPLSAVLPGALSDEPQRALSAHPCQPYTVHCGGGHTLTGQTIGHVEQPLGLFVFPPVGTLGAVTRRFVPRSAYERFEIGPPLGDVLVEQAAVSAADVQDAVQSQKKLRSRKIGEILVAKRIVTLEQLFAALDQQARLPMVRLGDALVALGYVNPDELAEALRQQQRDRALPLGELLTQRQLVSREQVRLAMATKLGFPWVDVEQCPPSPEALGRVPAPLARSLSALPLHFHGGRLVVALPDPTLRSAIDALEAAIGGPVAPVLAAEEALATALACAYPRDASPVAGQSGPLAARALDEDHPEDRPHRAEPADAAEPVVDLGPPRLGGESPLLAALVTLVQEAMQRGATDIHIEAQADAEAPLQVRLRRDGRLEPGRTLPAAWRHLLAAKVKTLADLDAGITRRAQSGRLPLARLSPRLLSQLPPQHGAMELQVTTLPTHQGLEDVLLRLPVRLRTRSLGQIALESHDMARLQPLLARPSGLLLVVGPARSGRTTTLHAMLATLNTPERTIYTAEERIEILQPGMRQVEVLPAAQGDGRSWHTAEALRVLQAADADVLMVGELRDRDSARLALDAASNGRLVLAGMSGRCAAEAVSHLHDLRLDAHQLADSLLGVHSQRLLRRLCSHCRMSRTAKDSEIAEWLTAYQEHGAADGEPLAARDALLADWVSRRGKDGRLKRYQSAGCPQCEGTGSHGRRAVHELLVVTREMRRLIRASAPAWHLHRQAQRDGLRTLRQDGIEKMLSGQVAASELRQLGDLLP
jgi:type II secretory ATPase GspE/PulE/Tfp pilus assembly ATPase PilB-like protein